MARFVSFAASAYAGIVPVDELVSGLGGKSPVEQMPMFLWNVANHFRRYGQWILDDIVGGIPEPGARIDVVKQRSDLVGSVCQPGMDDPVVKQDAGAKICDEIYPRADVSRDTVRVR